jgi:hypothetical protein
MNSQMWDKGPTPRIRLAAVGGDLRVSPAEGPAVELLGGEGAQVEEIEGGLQIECGRDCTLLVPSGANLEAQGVGGDAAISGIEGELLLRTIGGDLRLTRVGKTAVESVAGDLLAKELGGTLMADRVGGEARLEGVGGDVYLRSVGGDLRLGGLVGSLQATIGGDAALSLQPAAGSRSTLRAGGDVRCTLPEEASVRVRLSAGGDMRLAVPVECEQSDGVCEIRLGAAEAELELNAGGDISLRSGRDSWGGANVDLGDTIAAALGAEIGTRMADLEFKLNGLGDQLDLDSGWIGRRIRHAVQRAQRKAERARRWAEAAKAASPTLGEGELPTEEERLLVLRMLEQGKLSVDQADNLLEALEESA